MPAVADITLNNGEATPVAHTFNPVRVGENLVQYRDKVDGIVLGYPEVNIGNRLPSNSNRNYKATLKIRLPYLESVATSSTGITPGPTLAYTLSANVDVVIPARATQAQIDDLLAYLTNIMSNTQWTSAVDAMELPY